MRTPDELHDLHALVGSRVAPSTSGGRCTRPWKQDVGATTIRGAGSPPNGSLTPPRWRATMTPRPRVSAAICNSLARLGRWADRGPPPSRRFALRCPGDVGAGPQRTPRPRASRLGHRAPRRSLVRPPPVGPPSRRKSPATTRPGGGSAHHRLRPLPHRWQHVAPGTQLEGEPVSCRCSNSSRGSRRRRSSGKHRSCRPGWSATTPAGSTKLCLSGEVVWGRPRRGSRVQGEQARPHRPRRWPLWCARTWARWCVPCAAGAHR